MCLDDQQVTRRHALSLGALGLLFPLVRRRRSRAHVRLDDGLLVRPRDEWGADLPPLGTLQPEDDVRFLLVHHTAGRTEYGENAVADQIREVYRFHTGPAKGWADVCYNFFIDRFGGIWEGRQGSASGAVMADATGGSQGYAQLVCLLGNFHESRPSAEMIGSLELLLAHLAERHELDTTPGATTNFVSRGSNKWPAGAEVTATIISGHRDMSSTVCPGDYVYPLLAGPVSEKVHVLSGATSAASTSTTTPATTSTTSTTISAATTAPVTTAAVTVTDTSAVPSASSTSVPTAPPGADASEDRGATAVIAASVAVGGAAIAAGALAAAVRQRRVD